MTAAALLLFARSRWRDVALVGLLVVIVWMFAFCRPAGPRALPPAFATTVQRHEIATAVDTAEIYRLKAFADSALRRHRRDSVTAARLEAAAAAEARRADSLAGVAAAASSARDSAIAYHAAYDARTAEADSLARENDAKDSSIVALSLRALPSLSTALTVSERRANQADSVVHAAVKVIQASDPPCRIAHVFTCPSRMAIAVGGAVTTIAAGIAGYAIHAR